MAEQIFPEGIYLNKVNDNAPQFIKANVSLHREKAIKWLMDNVALADEKGYIKLIGKESKDGKRYFAVDTWKPTKSEHTEEIKPEDKPW